MPSPELTAPSNGITLTYQTFGSAGAAPLLLVMGLGAQLISWPDGLCQMLADSGFFVIRFDNRDSGRSSHMADAPAPDLKAARGGDYSTATYTLDDLADDAVGLLDHLRLSQAHIMGGSMGGMIAQTIAVRHPQRVRSLVSLFSTPAPGIGAATREAMATMLAPPPASREEAGRRRVQDAAVTGSPGFPRDTDALRRLGEAGYDRAPGDPQAVNRQLLAIWSSGDRTEQLRMITAPTLVVHGTADPLITPEGGRATAEAIDGAELVMVEGMAHDLPRGVWPVLVEAMEKLAARAA